MHVNTPNRGNGDDITTFLNSTSPELQLDVDPNDISSQRSSANYQIENDVISLSHSNPNHFFVSHFNIRSPNKYFDQLLSFVDKLEFRDSVIGICETWLNDSSPFPLLNINGYNLITASRSNKKGGGVGFYVSKNLNYEPLDEIDIISEIIECMFIEIQVPNRSNVIIGEIYRPPSSNPAEFNESLHALLSKPCFDNKTCIVMGDFNLNILKHHENHNCSYFLNLMLSKSYIPLIRKPTRMSDAASTLIDNIFINNFPSLITSGILVSDISDHYPTYALFSSFIDNDTIRPQCANYIRVMSETNLNKLREELRSINWSPVYNQTDVQISYDHFINIFTTTLNSTIPPQRPTSSNRKKIPRNPWITKSLLKSINRKNKLFYKYKRNPNAQNRSKYVRYRNILTSSLRMAKQMYYSRQFKKYEYDIKSTWKVVNEVLKSNINTDPPKCVQKDNRKIDNPLDMAELFNDFFLSM